jgi:hypothetical protein
MTGLNRWFLLLFVCAATPAYAATISIDFHGGRNNNPANGASVAPADFAGVTYFNVGNWNTVPNVTGAPNPFPDLATSPAPVTGLRNNFGAATTAAVSWTSNNAWDTNITANSGNTRLMRGYLDTTDTSASQVVVTGVPYGTYDVIVYLDGDNGGTSRAGAYALSSNGGFSQLIVGRDPGSTNGATLTQAFNREDPVLALDPLTVPAATFTATHNTLAAGNYVVFRGVTGSDITLDAIATSSSAGIPPAGSLRAPVNGIQITEQVPYPIFFSPNGSGGFNAYEIRRDQAAQSAAMNLAATMAFPGSSVYGVAATADQGHLAAVQNATENESIRRHLLGSSWIGLTDSTTYGGLDTAAAANNQSGAPLPAAGTPPVAGQKGFGWVWSRGRIDQGGAPVEQLVYQNWNFGEPNDSGAVGEDATEMLTNGEWNDNRNGEGNLTTSLHVQRDWVVEYDLDLPAPPSIPALPTPGPTLGAPRGMFKVTTARGYTGGTGQILHTQQADAFIRSGAGTVTTSEVTEINYNDPTGAGAGKFGGNITFDQDTPADDNDFAVVAKAKILVPQDGTYTFAVDSDDGFRLRIPGQTFTSGQGYFTIQPGTYAQGDTLENPWPRGGAQAVSLGVIDLPAGQHDIELLFFERAGGAHVELSAAPGAHSSFFNIPGTRASTFQLVGHRGTGAMTANVQAPGEIVGGAFNVREVLRLPFGSGNLNNLTDAGNLLNAPDGDDVVATYTSQFVNFVDPDSPGSGGDFQGDAPFGTDTPGDNNDIALRANAVLRIATESDFTYGFNGDDGGQLEFLDPDGPGGPLTAPAFTGFTRLGDTTAAHIVGIDGGKLFYNTNTGNSRLIGRIHLTPGDYPIEFTYWERGGGGFVELFGAVGSKTTLDNDFVLLGASSFQTFDSDGLQLVPEPSTWALAGIALAVLAFVRRRRLH